MERDSLKEDQNYKFSKSEIKANSFTSDSNLSNSSIIDEQKKEFETFELENDNFRSIINQNKPNESFLNQS